MPEVEITVRHQTISDHLACLSGQSHFARTFCPSKKNKYDKKRVKFKGRNSKQSVALVNTCKYILAPQFNLKK